MLKVLIVDDEPKVGELIRKLIHWDEHGLELAGIYQDGAAAWQAIQQDEPDIVITDIRMPVISGLDLVRLAAEEGRHIHFIIISGYRYFEYAHSALKYGVEDYLLKPIDEVALNKALAHIQSSGDNEAGTQLEMMKQELDNNRSLLAREFFRETINNPPAALSQTMVREKYGLSLWNGCYTVFIVRIDRNRGGARNEMQKRMVYEQTESIAAQAANTAGVNAIIAGMEEVGVVILLNHSEQEAEKVRELSHVMMGKLREYFSSSRDYTPTLGISQTGREVSSIPSLLQGALQAADQRLLEGINRRIKAELFNFDAVSAEEILAAQRKPFLNAVETMQQEAAAQIVQQVFDEALVRGAAGHVYYALGREFFAMMLSGNPAFPGGILEEWLDDLSNMNSLPQQLAFVKGTVSQYLAEYAKKRAEEDSRPIREAIAYIRENYAKRIHIEDVAALSYFNHTYFCELFKKETGKTFSDFLLEVRMDAAKELLRDTRLAIYEVAGQVGYKDAKYFSQQFARVVGVKPGVYRKLYK